MMNRKITASATALALAVSLAACSNDEGEADKVEATETAAEGTVTDVVEEDTGTVELTTQDGTKVLVPAGAANATEELGLGDWGEPVKVESRQDGTTLIEYDGGKNIIYTADGGPVALVGEIARVWKENGGLDNEIGLPTDAESERDDKNGWIQEFQNGTIEWLEENGVFGERVS